MDFIHDEGVGPSLNFLLLVTKSDSFCFVWQDTQKIDVDLIQGIKEVYLPVYVHCPSHQTPTYTYYPHMPWWSKMMASFEPRDCYRQSV